MKKSDRIAAFVESLGTDPAASLDARYLGYFQCFNDRLYYEAHDVLEDLWLEGRGAGGENEAFFKGLIQVAGAYVHLKKQFLRPDHPKDGRRLRPASRLFRLAMANLEPYRPVHLFLDVEALCRLCGTQAEKIVQAGYAVNPWRPEDAPSLSLESGWS